MTSLPNQTLYRCYAPVYDLLFRPVMQTARRRTLQLLALQPGERLLIPGVGTGLDLPLIPPGVQVTAGDVSPAMLRLAHAKTAGLVVDLHWMDAGRLEFANGSFDAVLFSLVLSVVPDARAAFGDAWRVLRPDGRVAIFDKFIPAGHKLTLLRRLAGRLFIGIGTDPNRHLSEILAGWPGLAIVRDEPSLLRGQYRIVLIEKTRMV